jgi:hypothetical protein
LRGKGKGAMPLGPTRKEYVLRHGQGIHRRDCYRAFSPPW